MISLAELSYLAEVFVVENRKILGTGALAGSLALLNYLGGGGPVSAEEMARINALSSARSPNLPAQKETTAQNSKTVIVNGISYSPTPGPEYPPGCATSQITTNVLTEQQLKQMSLKRGDQMYMKEGGGVGNKTAWRCVKGQRVSNSPPPLVPGKRNWH